MSDFYLEPAEQVQLITAEQLTLLLKQDDGHLSSEIKLLDVREPAAHQLDNLGGENIPVSEFSSQINQLDPDQATIIYCQVGQKSFNAATLLIGADFSCVYSLHGGLEAYKRWVKE